MKYLSAAVLSLLVLAGCANDDDPRGGDDPELAHVHGLGINPADSELYAATHHGLFRIPKGQEPVHIGDLEQDTMGFIVVGPDHFLGSGHPGPGDDRPNPLGLIETTDGGKSWESLSLSGEVDFHGLEFAHGRVYGFDSHTGQLMISDDKKTWEKRVAEPMADLAVSPENAETIATTTEQGLAVTSDGGKTFTTNTEAPRLVFLSWPKEDALLGITTDGEIYLSADGGKTFQKRGAVDGGPAALTAVDADTVYVASETGIYESTDGGRTFESR